MSDDASAAAESPDGRGLDRGRVDGGLAEAFAPQPVAYGIGPDNLATPKLDGHLPLAPPLSPSTLVCLGDESEFVLRAKRWGDVVARFKPAEVELAPNGEHYVSIELAVVSGASWRAIFSRLDVLTGRVRVEPVRPQCKFFAQQMTPFQGDTERQQMERLCTARRDEDSFFLGLHDSHLYACELRSPRDFVSEERIKKMNRTKIELGKERLREPGAFDVDSALERAEKAALDSTAPDGSIFGDR